MLPLMFRCPQTGNTIDSGVEIDRGSLGLVHACTIAVNCPHCGSRHDFLVAQGIWAKASWSAAGESVAAESAAAVRPAVLARHEAVAGRRAAGRS